MKSKREIALEKLLTGMNRLLNDQEEFYNDGRWLYLALSVLVGSGMFMLGLFIGNL